MLYMKIDQLHSTRSALKKKAEHMIDECIDDLLMNDWYILNNFSIVFFVESELVESVLWHTNQHRITSTNREALF